MTRHLKNADLPRAVYYHYDEHGRCQYVGVSANPMQRLAVHSNKSSWFQKVTRIDLVWLPSAAAALDHEAREILRLRPPNNVKFLEGAA